MEFDLHPKWRGLPIIPRKKEVFRELTKLGMDLYDVREILDKGFDCPRAKRKKGIHERCVRKGKKVRKVVVQKRKTRSGREIWLLRHVGEFGYKKKRFRK